MCAHEGEKGTEVAQKERTCPAYARTFWVICENQDPQDTEGARWIAFPSDEMTVSSVVDVANVFGGKVSVALEIEGYFRAGSRKNGQKGDLKSAEKGGNQASVRGQDADY